ncbi:MarR family transcriptional regulator [Microbacterium sp. X-17]|uniref:MarR family winged helix-turn-helix transcriptional regulator n=1 Tax=Microbacterium sp. X-17 TaxID=3144404 RepID=UPI0031F5C28A
MNESVKRDHGRPSRVGFALSQLGSFSASLFAERLAPLGLTPAAAGVLRTIARRPGLSQRALAAEIGTVPSRVVVLVDGLEAAGLVRRERSTEDRRTQLLRLTDAGTAAMAEIRLAAEGQSAALLGPLEPADRAELTRLLDALLAAHGLSRESHRGYREG